ncbi:hypothetical protein [Acinetobacter sp. A3]|uniref:hypothetical protein n=1 Tax=Acinetobacter sp. A3 TaxID=2725492 RepID=UPI00144851B4|nr:hypothetical protein [Acinetobacter sp. A3]
MKKLAIILSASAVLLSGCGSKNEKMLGYWQLENIEGKRIKRWSHLFEQLKAYL